VSDIKFQLSGWKAIAVIGIVVAVAGYRFMAVRTTLETGGADELKMWVLADYVRQGLPALEQALEGGDMQAAETQAQQLIASERIQFTEMKARGTPDDLVVRVKIRVDGGRPPDGREVRYFRMSHSTITGWRMERETSALGYYLKIF
jgi:hypothetical protein